jgi:amino acid efflux transporter
VAEAHLGRVVTLWPAVGLAITLVVGSGVLVLPGLAYAAHGAAAVWSWVIAAAVCVPLLVVIAALGARYPTAGGIAGFVRPALGDRTADIAELLLLGAIPGGAALALVAGQLVADLVAVPWLVGPVAAGMLLVAGAAAHRGAEFAGVLVRGLAATFVAMLLIVAIAGLASGQDGLGPGGVSGIRQGLAGVGLVFFAFVGWELMTFLSEEFVEPERDFPRMIAISFLIVIGLYIALALSVQVALDPHDPRVTTSPVATVAETALGDIGRAVVTVIGVLIVAANVQGVVLAFSRLVFANSRRGQLPRALAVTSPDGSPERAVLATVAAFMVCLVPERLGLLSQALLFELTASVFFTGFVLAAIAYTVEATRWRRVFGAGTTAIASVVLLSFGWVALYPLAVTGLGALRRTVRQQPR